MSYPAGFEEFMSNLPDMEEMVYMCQDLIEQGCDIINLSGEDDYEEEQCSSPYDTRSLFDYMMASHMMEYIRNRASANNSIHHNHQYSNSSNSTNTSDGRRQHHPHMLNFFFQPIYQFNVFPQEQGFHGQPPASKKAMEEQLKTVQLTKNHIEKEHHCAICIDEYHEQETATQMPCDHIYHTHCLGHWLKHSNTCPQCRYELFTDNQDYNNDIKKRMAERNSSNGKNDTESVIQQPCALETLGTCSQSHQHNHHTSVDSSQGNEFDNSTKNSELKKIELNDCGHSFHPDCLRPSLIINGYKPDSLTGIQNHIRCPRCRTINHSVIFP